MNNNIMNTLKEPETIDEVLNNLDIRIRNANAFIYIYKNNIIRQEIHKFMKDILKDVKDDILYVKDK